MQCTKCNRNIDDNFNLCPYCGEPIKKEIKCNNCGAVLEKDFKLCPYCGKPTTSQEPKTQIILQETKNESCLGVIFKFLFVILLLVAVAFGIYGISESCSKKSNQPSTTTVITKTKPTLNAESTLTGVNVYVKANDDYEEVNVIVKFKDSNGSISTYTLTGYNYKKSNTYTLTKNLSVSEMLTFSEYTYTLGYYK